MRLGTLLRDWRWANKLTVRQAAKAIGLSAPTFSRVERGYVPDAETLSKILIWLMEVA